MPQGNWMSAAEAWKQWWPVPEDSVLVTMFGAGEEELKALGASHVSKHVSAAMSKFSEQIFLAQAATDIEKKGRVYEAKG
eukprot:symbB.v1.2.031320.t1/scaffold3623.1/size53121/6